MQSLNFEELTENPPLKCPYFTLPDVCHLTKNVLKPRKRAPGVGSIVTLWGLANRMSEDHTTDFLLELLKYSSTQWKPDFQALAVDWKLDSQKAIKNRLKSIVESRKYKLEDDLSITGGDGPPKPDKDNQKNKTTLASGDAESVQTSHNVKKPVSSKKRKAGNDSDSNTTPRKKAKSKLGPEKNTAADAIVPVATKAKQKKKNKTTKESKDIAESIESAGLHDNDASDQVKASKKKTKKKSKLSGVVARGDSEHDEVEASEPEEPKQDKSKKIQLDKDLGSAEGEVLVIDDDGDDDDE